MNHEQATKGNDEHSDSGEWDKVRQAAQEYFQADREKAPEVAREYAEDLVHLESSFVQQLSRQEDRGKRISRAEFEKWEDDFSDSWGRMQSELSKVGVVPGAWVKETAIIEAEAERPLMLLEQKLLIRRPGEREEESLTVEAKAGHFYDERSTALLKAIDAAGQPSAEKDKATVHSLFHYAREHLAYKYPVQSTGEIDSTSYSMYNERRTKAHNNMIKSLNDINDLARKYGTRPLTPRNFWPSDRPQPTRPISERMRADRDIVESYVDIAFSDEVERAQRDQMR